MSASLKLDAARTSKKLRLVSSRQFLGYDGKALYSSNNEAIVNFEHLILVAAKDCALLSDAKASVLTIAILF